MARIRTIKPEFFRHEGLFEAERESGLPLRIAFAGLWTACDRAGRFKWRPRGLKLDVMPYDDVDFSAVLDALLKFGFVVKYELDGNFYGHVPSWTDHQHINQRETPSTIPAPDEAGARTCTHQTSTVVSRGEGKGKEGEGNGVGKTREHVRAPHSKPVRGQRWPTDAVVPDDWIAEAEGLREVAKLQPIDLRLEATKFANYWAAKAGGNAAKIDWRKTWQNWVLQAHGNGKNQGQSGRSSHPFGVFGDMLEREIDQAGDPESPDAPVGDLRHAAR